MLKAACLVVRAILLTLPLICLVSAETLVTGRVSDPQGQVVPAVTVTLKTERSQIAVTTTTDNEGIYRLTAPLQGRYVLAAEKSGFRPVEQTVVIVSRNPLQTDLQFRSLSAQSQSVTVTDGGGTNDITSPDPSQRIFISDEMLDANPGRPGVPLSIPGYPAETASGGIKAPQYFAPGVAGDHGEPIAQYLKVGNYLVPNNLSANAHGNGYSDPNMLILKTIESVQVDGGAFNVREGNHSVDLATTYSFKDRSEPFLTATGDSHDIDVAAGWSPADPQKRFLVAIETAFGNGLLDRPEHRRQYKITALQQFALKRQTLTLALLGYYGQSFVPGLVPIGVPGLHDTIDPRQRAQTHLGELVANDSWNLGSGTELQLSGFFRTYNLGLYSNFGDGLIRQSEFRTVSGGETAYVKHLREWLKVMTGVNYLRDAPRRLDLDHYESANPLVYGPCQQVTANNVTIASYAPYLAVNGSMGRYLGVTLGWRHDFIGFDNTDLLRPQNSFNKWSGVDSPKASVTLFPVTALMPSLSFSYGETYFTNDPRIGLGTQAGTLVNRAHAYQIVASKMVDKTELRLTLSRITTEQSFGKIDADTGLQESEGASRNRALTLSARRYFRFGLLQGSVSKADARIVSTGEPVPEAPRTILDLLGTVERLPFGLHFRGEFEYVGAKPLGDGFIGVPVREFRGALTRSFFQQRLDAGVSGVAASGYTGQTLETMALADEVQPFERVVGIRNPSSVSFTVACRLGRRRP